MRNSKKFYRKKQGNNKKVSKSRKDPKHNEKNKAAAASVSEENEIYDSHALETAAALKVPIADTYTHPKCIGPRVQYPALIYRSWGDPGITNSPGVFTPKTEIHTGADDRTLPGAKSCAGHDLEAMAALGVTVCFTHKFARYDGPPIKNSAANEESWAALGDPYIH